MKSKCGKRGGWRVNAVRRGGMRRRRHQRENINGNIGIAQSRKHLAK